MNIVEETMQFLTGCIDACKTKSSTHIFWGPKLMRTSAIFADDSAVMIAPDLGSAAIMSLSMSLVMLDRYLDETFKPSLDGSKAEKLGSEPWILVRQSTAASILLRATNCGLFVFFDHSALFLNGKQKELIQRGHIRGLIETNQNFADVMARQGIRGIEDFQ